MELKQCDGPVKHFYDAAKNAQCPYCNGGMDIGVARVLGNETSPAAFAEAPAFPKTGPLNQPTTFPVTLPINSPETNKTIALHVNEQGIDPIRGWLVCLNGKKKGKDFRIHSEKNFIGRSRNNDICLDFDETISRDCNAIVTYDSKTNKFWLQSGDGKGNIYLNDNILLVPAEIKDNDVVTVGQTELMFMSYCNANFKW